MSSEHGIPQDDTAMLLLNRYRIEAMLGEGGLGTVYRAYDTRLKRMVAVKTLKRALVNDLDLFRSLEERFTREAEAGSRMGTHPHLVTVHDLVVEPDRTQYLIQEYVAGGTVATRIVAGKLPVADALRITADAADGLQAAHEAGIVHRDVKPANLFLTPEGRAKVGDFGIVQIDHISKRTRTTTGHPGTPLYMSPEQSSGTSYVRPESDQYSLGLVLFEMLTGSAYKRQRKAEVAAALASQPDMVRVMLARMLATDPDDRYPTMSDVRIAATLTRESLGHPASQPPVDPAGQATILPQPITPPTPLLNLQPVPSRTPPPPHNRFPDGALLTPWRTSGFRRTCARRGEWRGGSAPYPKVRPDSHDAGDRKPGEQHRCACSRRGARCGDSSHRTRSHRNIFAHGHADGNTHAAFADAPCPHRNAAPADAGHAHTSAANASTPDAGAANASTPDARAAPAPTTHADRTSPTPTHAGTAEGSRASGPAPNANCRTPD